MNKHVEPTAQHATYSPSSAKRWTVCTASAEAIAHLGEQDEGDAAKKGTAAHEELERVLDGGEPDADHPSSYAVALAVAYVRGLPPGQMWVEQRVQLTSAIWGRCDVSHFSGDVLTIVDLKDGFVGVEADAEQLQIYAAASIKTHNLPAKWIRLVVVQPNDFRPVPRVKQTVISAADLAKFAERVSRIPTGPKSFVAGEQCTYCPLFGRCEASRDILRDVGALVAGLMQPQDVRPEQRALFKACEKPIKDAFAGAEKAWTKDALANGAPAGLKIVATQKHRAWENEATARAAVVAALGVDALELPTPAQAEKLGMDRAAVGALATTPEGGPALAFESDKRKPWAAKSVTEMFKGVGDLVGSVGERGK